MVITSKQKHELKREFKKIKTVINILGVIAIKAAINKTLVDKRNIYFGRTIQSTKKHASCFPSAPGYRR